MGLFVASSTRQSLIAEKNELEHKVMLIKEAKMELANSTKDLVNAGSDLDPDSVTVKELNMRKERLNNLERKLDMELAEYQARLEMVNGLMQEAKRKESEAIKDMYS